MTPMQVPEVLGMIAGRGRYPICLAESARVQGVQRIVVSAMRGETDRRLFDRVDAYIRAPVGALRPIKDFFAEQGVHHAVMAGQVRPTALFRVRPDEDMRNLLRSLPEKNAHTIFGAVCAELVALGIEMMPASLFMESHMPAAGLLTYRAPTEGERLDIELGRRVSEATSDLDIGQTVVVKDGTILAVEAFEGTDRAIRRAGKLGGKGSVVVKRAKPGHDMRFDIPVIGHKTLHSMRRAQASVLAVEEGRCILLDREKVLAEANRLGITILVLPAGKVMCGDECSASVLPV